MIRKFDAAGISVPQKPSLETSDTVYHEKGISMSRNAKKKRSEIKSGWVGAFCAYLLLFWVPANSTIQPIREEYSNIVEKSKSISPIGFDYFGENIDYSTGRTEFRQVDLVLPGNNSLNIEVARRMVVDAFNPSRTGFTEYQFYDWELDIPYLYGVFPASVGWASSEGGRCSGPTTAFKMRPSQPHGKSWAGNHLHLPGDGDREILFRPPGLKGSIPNGAKYVTTGDWGVSCLPALKNGEGEGFVGIGPNGHRYYFDWMVGYYALPAIFPNPAWPYSEYMTFSVPRQEIRIYPTKIEDQFGNSVNYNWSGNRLISITSSDGRQVTIGYNGEGRISEVNSGGRIWTYEYNSTLSAVTNPDGSRWSFNNSGIPDIRNMYDRTQDWTTCRGIPNHCLRYVMDRLLHCSWMRKFNPAADAQRLLTITSPSGAAASYTFRPVRHARTDVPNVCMDYGEPYDAYLSYNGIAVFYDTFSIVGKSLSGPGIEGVSWTFNYPVPSGAYMGASPTTDISKQVSIVRSDGVTEVRTFGKVYSRNENQLLGVSKGGKVDSFEYVSDGAVLDQPFPDYVGKSAASDQDPELRPLLSRETTLDGATFKYKVELFDAFARPVSEVQSSSLGFSRSQGTEYHDNISKWVLGRISRTTVNGIEAERADYDGNAMPVATYAFGKRREVRSYNSDGTVATVSDGNNRVTTLSDWKRGIPQSIKSADNTIQTAEVNDAGWVTSVVDENGSKTCYRYDAMGLINRITQPSETQPSVCDESAWLVTNIEFRAMTAGEWRPPGVQAGQWRQYTSTGNYQKVVYFDSLWRPVLTHEYDAANTSGTLRAVSTSYNVAGRVAFQSYPSSDLIPAASGSWTTYDALDRVTQIKQDSEQGQLTTTTEYLTGFLTRVTRPDGEKSVTTYQALDQPTYEHPIRIEEPLGRTTVVPRDVFGKPIEIERKF